MIRALFLEELSMWNWAWQSTLFALIGLAGSFLLRRRPARACQGLFLGMVAAVLVPIMSVLVAHFGLGLFAPESIERELKIPYQIFTIDYEAPVPVLSADVQLNMEPAEDQANAVPEEPAPVKAASQSISIPWRLVFLSGWMIAGFILLGRLFVAFVGGVCLLRRAKSRCGERIQRAANSARARLEITKDFRIRSGKNVRSPMIWCWSQPPVLLVPGDLDDNVDWVDVVCHELAHWRRRDHLSGLFAELAVCILPWNPFLWWARKRVVRLSEQACDDWVLAGGRAGTDYAQSLLNLSPKVQMAFLPTIIGKEKPMKERIYRIVKEKYGDPRIGMRWALAMAVIAATLTVGVAFAQRRPAQEGRELHAFSEQRVELKSRARELKAQMARLEDELAELEASGKGQGDQAYALRTELREIREAMGQLERKFRGVEDKPRELRAVREQRRDILRRLEELGHKTELELRRLEEQQLGRSEEALALQRRMWELNEHMREVRREFGRQLAKPDRRRRPEPEERRRPEMDRRVEELSRLLDELQMNTRDKERALRALEEQGKGQTEDAREIRGALEEIHGRMQVVKEELGDVERERARIREDRGRFERGPSPEAMMREQEELRERARQIERELEELGDEHPERTEQLRTELREIRGRLERRAEIRVERRVRIDRDWEPDLVMRQLELEEQAHQIENRLEELGDGHPDQTEELRAQLDQVHEQLQNLERERGGFGPDGPPVRERDDLERQVQELRVQVNNVNEQMGELRELLKRLLEEGGPQEGR